MNIDTPFLCILSGIVDAFFSLQLLLDKYTHAKKSRGSKFSPNSNFMTSFSSCKNYVNLWYCLLNSCCFSFPWLTVEVLTHIFGAHSFLCTCSVTKSHMKTSTHIHRSIFTHAKGREKWNTLHFFCTGRKSRNLCINMYKRWINWMCKKANDTKQLIDIAKEQRTTTNEG